MTAERTHRRGPVRATLAGLTGLAAIVLVSAAVAAPASAQVPDLCDQYPDIPQCQQGGGGAGNDDAGAPGDQGGGGNAPGAGGPTASAGEASGELPFTGYPLTPLLLLLLALLAAGLTVRAYIAIRDRSHTRGSGRHDGTA